MRQLFEVCILVQYLEFCRLFFVAAKVQIFVLWAAFWTVLQGRLGQQLGMVLLKQGWRKWTTLYSRIGLLLD